MTGTTRKVARTLALGLAGAAMAHWLGLPAGALVGSALTVSAAAWAGMGLAMDPRLRDAGFAVIGIVMGAGISSQTLAMIPTWGVSLAFMTISILSTLALSAWILRALIGLSKDTAILGSTPGTMSYALAIAADGRADQSIVLVLQTMRLFMLTAALPILISFAGVSGSVPPSAAAPPMSLADLALVGIATLVLGRAFARLRIPAGFFVAGILASAVGHATDVVAGPPDTWLIFAGFTLTGATIGSQFTGIGLRKILALGSASVIVVGLAAAISALFADLAARLLGLPFGAAWIAYAPGGVEAMSAIALALGYDPAFIAIHHFGRIIVLMVALPVALKTLGPRAGP